MYRFFLVHIKHNIKLANKLCLSKADNRLVGNTELNLFYFMIYR